MEGLVALICASESDEQVYWRHWILLTQLGQVRGDETDLIEFFACPSSNLAWWTEPVWDCWRLWCALSSTESGYRDLMPRIDVSDGASRTRSECASRARSVGDSYDNSIAESAIGLFKTELHRRHGPWRNLDHLELAILEWVDWFNHRRLHCEIGDIPPAECEAAHYRQITIPELARTN